MAGKSPWSIKGVDPEAREAAKIAARRAGMTVGQWISHSIRNAAAQQLSSATRPVPESFRTPAHGDDGNGSGDPAAGFRTAQPPAPTMQAVFENLQNLAKRIEQAEVTAASAIRPLAEQVERLTQQIENAQPGSSLSTAPIERAVSRLAERLERLEESARPKVPERRWRLFGD